MGFFQGRLRSDEVFFDQVDKRFIHVDRPQFSTAFDRLINLVKLSVPDGAFHQRVHHHDYSVRRAPFAVGPGDKDLGDGRFQIGGDLLLDPFLLFSGKKADDALHRLGRLRGRKRAEDKSSLMELIMDLLIYF